MRRWNRGNSPAGRPAWRLALMGLGRPRETRAEDLQQAWAIALGVNQGLQAQQQTSIASDFEVKAANSARYFTVRSYNIDTFLAQSPKTRATISGNGLGDGDNGTGSTGTTRARGIGRHRVADGLPRWARSRASCRSR